MGAEDAGAPLGWVSAFSSAGCDRVADGLARVTSDVAADAVWATLGVADGAGASDRDGASGADASAFRSAVLKVDVGSSPLPSTGREAS